MFSFIKRKWKERQHNKVRKWKERQRNKVKGYLPIHDMLLFVLVRAHRNWVYEDKDKYDINSWLCNQLLKKIKERKTTNNADIDSFLSHLQNHDGFLSWERNYGGMILTNFYNLTTGTTDRSDYNYSGDSELLDEILNASIDCTAGDGSKIDAFAMEIFNTNEKGERL